MNSTRRVVKLSADGGGDGGGFFDQLLRIEPQNANLIDAFLGDTMPICVRYVSWIFTANNTEKIPDYLLSRIEIFDISQPTPADYRNGLLHSIFGSLVDELPYGGLFAPVLASEVIDHLAESGMSPREIRRALEEAMEGAVCTYADTPNRGSVRLTPRAFQDQERQACSAGDRLHSGDCGMRENENEGQGGGCDIDFASILLEIEPGYVVVGEASVGSRILYVPPPMSLGDGVQASLGFELDGDDGVLGRPVFLHRRMQIGTSGTSNDVSRRSLRPDAASTKSTALIDRRSVR